MARIIFIDSRLEVQPDQLQPKQPRRRKYNRIDPDNLPTDAELEKMLREMYGDSLPAFLSMAGEL